MGLSARQRKGEHFEQGLIGALMIDEQKIVCEKVILPVVRIEVGVISRLDWLVHLEGIEVP